MNLLKRLLHRRPESAPVQPAAASEPPKPTPPADFPYSLTPVSGNSAVREWERYQQQWRNSGCSAVMVGDVHEVIQLGAALRAHRNECEAALRAGESAAAEDFFADRRKAIAPGAYPDNGRWPAQTPAETQLQAHLDLRRPRQPKPTVYLAKIPTDKTCDIFGYLNYGGWNECPNPEQHIAAFRHWHEQFGVEIYAVVGSLVECVVPRPPADRQAAIELAHEQYLYCPDLVEQGASNIYPTAASLLHSKVWCFWWD